jgi:predicted cupin superfamily sugar epimerase
MSTSHQPASYWVEKLQLQAHPEGGFFKEMYRSEESIPAAGLPGRYAGSRPFGTGIYFLIDQDNFSAFHRVQSDEMWHFYAGHTAVLHIIHPDGRYEQRAVGRDPEQGEAFQVVVPGGSWFAASVAEGYALVGCTVCPGFDFADFELADHEGLSGLFPQHTELIRRFTRG